MPATPDNERLIIHLTRLGHALRAYGDNESPTGLDARGEVFVRYGEPNRIRLVDFNDGEILRVARNLGIHVSRADYPDNEVWIYDRLSDHGIYLFYKGRDNRYVLGSANDLIPRGLRARGGNRGPRAAGYTVVGLMTLRHVLGQLALFHPSYSSRYAETQNYVSYIEETARTRRRRGAGGARMPDFVTFDQDGARGFIDALARNDVSDEGIAAARRETMPTQSSPAMSEPLELRLVRFLDGGATVRELIWSSPTGGRSTVWQTAPDRALLADTLAAGGIRVGVEAAASSQIGVQVDQRVGDPEAGFWRPQLAGYINAGPDLNFSAKLELSDPLPFVSDDVVEDGEILRSSMTRDNLRPLYATTLVGVGGLGVYLEAYLPAAAGAIRVRYRIERQRDGRLLRRSRTESEEFEFIRTVQSATVPVVFLVDRANWEGADTLRLVVEVEDLGTAATVRREVSIQVE